MVEPKFWEGNFALFFEVSVVLSRVAEGSPVPLSDRSKEPCRKASSLFHQALSLGTTKSETPEALKARYFFRRFAESRMGWDECCSKMQRAVATLNALVEGQRPDAHALEETSQLCLDIGNCMYSLSTRLCHDDDD